MKTLDIENLIQRQEILNALKQTADELRALARSDLTATEKRKVNVYKAAIYCYSTLLRGLKDVELDSIQHRLSVLEEGRQLTH